jgi:hypothetical protein
MSPIEIAKAFNAPILRDADDNAKPEEMLRSVKGCKVPVWRKHDGSDSGNIERRFVTTRRESGNLLVQESPLDGIPPRRLYLAPHGTVESPQAGETFE